MHNLLLLILLFVDDRSVLEIAREKLAIAQNGQAILIQPPVIIEAAPVVPAEPEVAKPVKTPAVYVAATVPVAAPQEKPATLFKLYTSDGWPCIGCRQLEAALASSGLIPEDLIETVPVAAGGISKYGKINSVPRLVGPDGVLCGFNGTWAQSLATFAGRYTQAMAAATLSEPEPDLNAGIATCTGVNGLAGIPAAIARHLAECIGESPTESPTESPEQLTGGLLDFEVDVADWVPGSVATFLKSREWSSGALELSVALPESTSVTVNGNAIQFSKPLIVTKRMGGRLSVDAELHQITISSDGRTYEFDLRGTGRIGVPDLTVVLK